MASKGNPLSLGLGIDFAALDSDLSRVADKIEGVGKKTSLKVGTLAGLGSAGGGLPGGMPADQMVGQMARVGASLSQGIGTGVRTSTGLMLGMVAQINASVDRMAGVTVAAFTRMDAAVRFERFDSAITRVHLKLQGLWTGAKKDQTDLDTALAGGFGSMAQKAAKIFKVLFTNLGKDITGPIKEAVGGIAPAIEQMANRMVQAMDASSRAMLRSMSTAIDGIGAKFKGMTVVAGAAGEASGHALMAGFQPTGKYISQFTERMKKTRPTEAGLASGFGALSAGQREELLAPPPPPPQTKFAGRVAEPQLGAGFLEVGKQATQAISAGISTAREKFAAFSKEGYTFNQVVMMIGKSFGGWGMAIAIPIGALAKLGEFVVRTGAFFVDMGALAYRSFNRITNLLTSIGTIGKKSFADLYKEHGIFAGSMLGGVKVVHMLVSGLIDLVTLRAFRRVGDDVQHFGSSVKTSAGLVGKLTGSVGKLGVELAAALGVVGVMYKVVQFFQGGVKAAAELSGEVARSKVVFGESFAAIEEQADKTTKSFKISKSAQLDLASGFGSMAQGAGVSEEKSADLANQLTSLAVDMTGLGVSFTEVSEAMKTGLSGRAISLKQFSVNIDENTTKQFAWKTGIARAGQELTNQQTLMARAGQILKGMSYAQGALTANVGQAAVQFQTAGGGVAVFGEQMGELLLPAVQELAMGFNQLLDAILRATEGSMAAIKSWGDSISNAFSVLGVAVRNSGDLWEVAQLRVNDFVTNALAYMFTLPENLQRMWKYIGDNWRTLLTDMVNAAAAFGTNLATNFMNLGQAIWDYLKGGDFKFDWTPLLDGFKAASEELPKLLEPNLVSSQAKIDEIYGRIGEKEQKLKEQAIKPIAGIKQPPLAEGGKTAEYKLGGALEAGTKEAQSAISKGQAGRGSTTDAVKQGVAVQRDIARTSREHLEWVKAHPAMPALAVK